MNEWYKLDNAAKLFPAVTSEKNSSVFRIAAVLNEPADKDALQKAVDHIYDRFPMLFVKMRKGVFWQYLDGTRNRFPVQEEQEHPCTMINPYENNGYLFKILYSGNRISLEIFHSLTDGGGATEFLKTILYYYLSFLGHEIEDEGKIILINDGAYAKSMEDSYAKNYERIKQNKQKSTKQDKAFQIKGTSFEPYGQNIISGIVSANALNKAAKAKNATITSYLASLLIYSIYSVNQKYTSDRNPIILDVPVSLRSRFQSGTLRNFFAVVNVGMIVDDAMGLDCVIREVTNQLKTKTEKEALFEVMANNINLEKALYSRIIPLFIKKALIQIGYNIIGEAKTTMAISNLGNIQVPSGFSQRIKNFEMNLYTTSKSPLKCAVCSVNDRLTISISRSIMEADIIRFFMNYLSDNDGLDVEIYSNDWGRE